MKKREYNIIENLQGLLLKEVNSDFLRACDNTTTAVDQSHQLEAIDKPKIKNARIVKVAPCKSVGARLFAIDIYKGMKKDFKADGVAEFTLDGFYCVKCKDISFKWDSHGFIATNQVN